MPKFNISAIILLLLLFTFEPGRAQNAYQSISSRIDSLADRGLPKSALVEVDKLDALARKNNNAPQIIRAAIYHITFQSYIEENALLAIMSKLRADIQRSAYPVQPVLRSLLADMYWRYYQQERWQINGRTRLAKPDPDITRWDVQTLISATNELYRASLQNLKRLQDTPVSVLDGVLAGDTTTRYLRPTLYDLLLHRALEFYLNDETSLPKPRNPFNLNEERLFADSRTFAALPINTTDTASVLFQGIKYLQQATAFHLQKNNAEALADIDLKRLTLVYSKSTFPQKDSLYFNALHKLAKAQAANAISADVWMAIGNYYKAKDSLVDAHKAYSTALKTYPESVGGKNAAISIAQIEEPSLSATVEAENLPGKPMLALVNYKNLQAANITIYKLSQPQLEKFNQLNPDAQQERYRSATADKPKTAALVAYLKAMTPVQTQALTLPGTQDHRSHTAEFKIDPLGSGNYILVSKKAASIDSLLSQITTFAVSDLAYAVRKNPDDESEFRVMHRYTGKPLAGVKVQVTTRTYVYDQSIKRSKFVDHKLDGATDKNGLFKASVPQGAFTVRLAKNTDTLISTTNFLYGQRDNEDDEPTEKTILFTDRQIYRPGQTIYFKGLQLHTWQGKNKILTGKAVELQLLDDNERSLVKQNFTTNNFGSFSGTFIIPQNALNGNMRLKTNDGGLDIKVEEYKRPTFKVQFDEVKQTFRFKDSVKITGKVMAFSGYGLSAARVAYRVRRTYNNVTFVNPKLNSRPYEPATEIAADTLITDNQGNYTIKFKSLPGDPRVGATSVHRYEILADVTDASGETHSGNTSFSIGTRDINLQARVPGIQLVKDSVKIGVTLTTLNNQPLKGNISLQLYALQQPGRLFAKRLWTVPQYHLLTQAQHESAFPDIAYTNQDQYENWSRTAQIATTEVPTTTVVGDFTVIDLDQLRKQPSGIYQVVISAKAANGDTASIKRYINFINKPGQLPVMAGWVTSLNTRVNVGEDAEFLVGLAGEAHVLAEQYRGAKIVSSAWMDLNKQRSHKMKIVAADDDMPAVQYFMLYHNRFYNTYQNLTILHPEKRLNIKLLTFRDKLQPDQKEQWKLQVTGYKDDLQAAEMVAAMYDASLDDITAPKDWYNLLDPYPRWYNYFAWNTYNLSKQQTTQPLYYNYRNYSLVSRNYEQLNLFGYNYFGGYNNAYHQHLNNLRSAINLSRLSDEKLEQDYKNNATLVKNGYDITGKITDGSGVVPGVSIRVKGTAIGTTSNSKGQFKIRVPANGTLTFTFIGFIAQEITTTKAASLSIQLKPDGKALNEVAVVGYGVQKRSSVTGAVSVVESNPNEIFTSVSGRLPGINIQVRGSGSVALPADVVMYVVDGVVHQGTLSDIDPSLIASIEVLKDAKSTALYGARAANGVVLVTTKAKMGSQPLVIRKNFNETAFFYPQLRTNEKGDVLVDFTIPGSLTKWRFRAFAHTQNLANGYIQKDVVTQKQLMISANTPRFLREGDTITIAARVANLTAQTLKGRVQLQLFNALDMQPVKLLADPAKADQAFETQANTNKAISFKLIIPAGLDALTYRLTAQTDAYSDGEENTLPVLPNRSLLTESMPMMVRSGQTKQFRFDKLIDTKSKTLVNKTLTLEYTQNPAWYAVQALPYLMEFTYECSEQTFSRYFANSLSAAIVSKNPQIKTVFDRWRSADSKALLSNLEKNPELKATLLEETPWLQDAISESEQKKRIALLYDLNKLGAEQESALDKLLNKQLPNGAFPWFGGEYADRYITQHIIAGIGQLRQLKIGGEAAKLQIISKNALGYLDGELLKEDKRAAGQKGYKVRTASAMEIHAWYARSYYAEAPLSAELKPVLQLYLSRVAKQWATDGIYQQALIALTMQRYGKPDEAKAIIRSLMETAQQNNDNGMYWAKNQLGWYWYESPIETQALMIELFTEVGGEPKAIEEMKIWLLRSKQTTNWRTTKATAAACYALLMKGTEMLTGTDASTIKLGGQPLADVKPDIKAEAGTGYIKTSWADEQVRPDLGRVEVINSGKNISWGAMYWQYTEQLDKITPSRTEISLERKYFIEKRDASGPVLTVVNATHQPKVGDILKVVVYLKAGRDHEYIHLKDMRPAGTEPVDVLSTFKYQDGLYYYQVTKDVATNFFISRLNKGNYVFEYKLRVAQPGNFSTGISTVQSMYAPEFNAHSEGSRIRLEK